MTELLNQLPVFLVVIIFTILGLYGLLMFLLPFCVYSAQSSLSKCLKEIRVINKQIHWQNDQFSKDLLGKLDKIISYQDKLLLLTPRDSVDSKP